MYTTVPSSLRDRSLRGGIVARSLSRSGRIWKPAAARSRSLLAEVDFRITAHAGSVRSATARSAVVGAGFVMRRGSGFERECPARMGQPLSRRSSDAQPAPLAQHACPRVVGRLRRELVTRELVRSVLASKRRGYYPESRWRHTTLVRSQARSTAP